MDNGIGSLNTQNANSLVSESQLRSMQDSAKRDSTQVAAKKMEALFATMLVKELRRALPDGFFGKGTGADTFNGWFDQHIGESLAANDTLGLAGMVKASFDNSAEAPPSNGDSQ